jgi:hypothetical protein
MQCSLCTAKLDPASGDFIVSHGKPLSAKAWNSRCCHYAIQRGRKGCINVCRDIDPAETLEGRMGFVNTALQTELALAEQLSEAQAR